MKNFKQLTLTVPSKTFLIGEYLVLDKGPGILINTAPRFQLTLKKINSLNLKLNNITPAGPVAKLIASVAPMLQGCHLDFFDPHENAGGFGASAAQYTMILIANEFLQFYFHEKVSFAEFSQQTTNQWSLTNIDYPQIVADYQGLSADIPNKKIGSGADVIAQLTGAITYFHAAKNSVQTFAWPFADLDFLLIHTGNKIATHQHLAQLNQLNTTEFAHITHRTYQAFQQSNAKDFIAGIQDYGQALTKAQLTHPLTQTLLAKIHALPQVLAAKGCGALGADVLLLLCAAENAPQLRAWTETQSFKIIASRKDLTQGLTINFETHQ